MDRVGGWPGLAKWNADRVMDSSGSLRRIAMGLFDGVEELDAVGPWEVLSFWTAVIRVMAGRWSLPPPTVAP